MVVVVQALVAPPVEQWVVNGHQCSWGPETYEYPKQEYYFPWTREELGWD